MRSRQEMTLTQESIDKFHNWSLGRGQSHNTARGYRSDLQEFMKATGETAISMEEYEDLAQGWLNLTRRQVAPKTTGRRLTALRSYARWAGYAGLLDEYVAPTPAKGQPHPIPEGMTGVERMIEVALNNEQKALVGLLGYAGLRVNEALDCTVDWFNMNEMLLTVRGKGDKTRIIPVSNRAWSAVSSAFVEAACGDGRLVHYQDRSARKAITSLGRKAGLSRAISSHDLRATFATHVYDVTKDQRVVQELLGHASGTTTEVYIAVGLDKMKKAVEF